MRITFVATVVTLGLFVKLATTAPIKIDPRVVKLPGCTGFIVNENYLFTAKHCLPKLGNTVTIQSNKYGTLECPLVYEAESEHGVLVYKIPKTDKFKRYPSFKIATSPAEPNELVHSLGFPGGFYAITYGPFISSGEGDGFSVVGLRINPGCSGGPLLNEKDEVVGLSEAVASDIRTPLSFFTSLRKIKKAISKIKSKKNSVTNVLPRVKLPIKIIDE